MIEQSEQKQIEEMVGQYLFRLYSEQNEKVELEQKISEVLGYEDQRDSKVKMEQKLQQLQQELEDEQKIEEEQKQIQKQLDDLYKQEEEQKET